MNINLIERYILESIYRGSQTLEQLQRDTELSRDLIQKVCSHLEKKEILTSLNDEYRIKTDLNNVDIEMELNELTQNYNQLFFQQRSMLKLKKFYCPPEKEQMLKALIINLESFIEGLEKSHKPLSQHKVFYLGLARYQEIIQNEYQENI